MRKYNGGDAMTFKEELIVLLEKQLNTLNALKKITDEKTQVLLDENLEELVNITKTEENLINRVGTLEMEREHILDSWGLVSDTSISTIISNLPEEEREDLIQLGEKLYEVIYSIDETNKLNSKLLVDNMEWVEFNLNLLTDVQTPTTYGKGNNNAKTNNRLFDRKV